MNTGWALAIAAALAAALVVVRIRPGGDAVDNTAGQVSSGTITIF